MVLNELEEKLSRFYGIGIRVSSLVMDTWLCSRSKEVDNVILCLEKDKTE